ncbi:hypothetical protein Syun_027258 [Stephania yunnanensis]|uniref:Uncharacterized protein n=1 Tax=Stephania yunnanensis TaxID=152371 RepID=A0AAP0EIN0_9MAGN
MGTHQGRIFHFNDYFEEEIRDRNPKISPSLGEKICFASEILCVKGGENLVKNVIW